MIIWEGVLDEKYTVRVSRTEPYRGKLEVLEGDKLLMESDVSLSYDAKFGPDVGDVAEWEIAAMDFIDER